MASNHASRVYDSILGLLPDEGNPTPLVRLHRVVPFRHARVYAKLEWYNPFGAVKDRVAANLIRDAEAKGTLVPGQKLVEATSGNTGLGLAMVGNAKGYSLRTPLSAAIPLEKRVVLRFFGAEVQELDDSLCPAPGAPEGAIAKAQETAANEPGFVLLDQYTNEANPDAHFRTTGPEIWRQTEGKVDGFTCSVGTGGTLAGVAIALKKFNPKIKIAAADPLGAAIYSWIKTGRLEMHGTSITEGIGQSRVTGNLEGAPIDDAYEISDPEALPLIFELLEHEGLCMGGSTGINVAGAIRMAREMGPGHTIVTILGDYGNRYQSKLFNPKFLKEKGLPCPPWLVKERPLLYVPYEK